jgi:histidyl-tRNA synthetase
MKKLVQAVKGMRDFYPEQMAIRIWLYNTMREVAESFGYQEYEAPILESIDLYAAKSGDELVKEQSYVFRDRGGEMVTLRPELTPTLVRMIAQRQQQLAYPLRWWSWGPFWRYERPQKGRAREFFQWNIDLIGVASPEADAEIVATLATFFNQVGLTPNQVIIKINNRRLMNAQMEKLGIPSENRSGVSQLIDRQDKMQAAEWDSYAKDLGLDARQLSRLKDILQNKELWRESEELICFFKATQALGIQDYLVYDPRIMRGLAYYTGTVFEAWAITGEFHRAILGGGRYDNLMTDVGGDPLPGVGYAMGDMVITILLKELGLIPGKEALPSPKIMVTVFDEAHMPASLSLATDIRKAGLKVISYPEAAKLPRQFRYADRIGIHLALVVGPDEVAKGLVTIKDLSTGNQQSVARNEVVLTIRKILDSPPAS